ncbi:MAG: HlyD family secretion protein, partial [Cyanobacteria bacterium P01_F01_bin.3]
MKRWHAIWTIVAILGITTTVALYRQVLALSAGASVPPVVAEGEVAATNVTALGRLEPQGGVIDVAPNILGTSHILVSELHVELGDWVEAGELLAVLGNHATHQAAVIEAQQRVNTAAARLAQVQAGAKTGEIHVQEAAIARLNAQLQGDILSQQARIVRLTAELQNTLVENQRYQDLYDEGAISIAELETRQTSSTVIQEQVREAETLLTQIQTAGNQEMRQAEANLERIQEIRPADITLATEELKTATASLQSAQIAL